jgi:hypothetical protein
MGRPKIKRKAPYQSGCDRYGEGWPLTRDCDRQNKCASIRFRHFTYCPQGAKKRQYPGGGHRSDGASPHWDANAWQNFCELLRAAEKAAFEVFLTTDKNIRYQQNLADRVIAIVVLGNSRWPVVRLYVDRIAAAITAAKAGSYAEIEIPDR